MEPQNQPDTRTPYVAVKQVIPGYASGQAKILAIVQAVLGGLVLVFGIVAFGVDTFTSVGGTSILVAIPLGACALLGFLSSVKKTVWAIVAYLTLSVVCLCLSVALLIAAAIGAGKEAAKITDVHHTSREAIDVIVALLATLCGIATGLSGFLCMSTIFYGCCKMSSGATYVTGPTEDMQGSRGATTAPSDGPGLNNTNTQTTLEVGSVS